MFELRIPLKANTVEAVKRDLGLSLPQVKSSHRVEAAARGLGFLTHAALLASVRAGNRVSGPVNGEPFQNYLLDHDYRVASEHFYRAVARGAICDVLEREPRLSYCGYYIDGPERLPNGKRETAIQHHERFLKEREKLSSDLACVEFLQSLVLLQQLRPIKNINHRAGSYGLKHIAEKIVCHYPGGEKLGPGYIANGTLIVAAVHAGFKYKTYVDHLGYESVNVAFNMSRVSIDDVLIEVDPSRLTDYRAVRATRRSQIREKAQGLTTMPIATAF
jgi:hypothetical protein